MICLFLSHHGKIPTSEYRWITPKFLFFCCALCKWVGLFIKKHEVSEWSPFRESTGTKKYSSLLRTFSRLIRSNKISHFDAFTFCLNERTKKNIKENCVYSNWILDQRISKLREMLLINWTVIILIL